MTPDYMVKQHDRLREEFQALAKDWRQALADVKTLREALAKIMNPEGTYRIDKEEYLANVIEWCQDIAKVALATTTKES